MSFVGDMLGGDSGSPSQVVDTTPDEFVGLRGPIAQSIRQIINRGGSPQFQGQTTADISGNEQALLDQIFGATTNNPFSDTARNTLTQTAQGQFLSPDSNPFLQQTIEAAQRPIIQQFEEQVLPNTRSQFTNAGQFIQATGGNESGSSPFDVAQNRAGRDFINSLGDISTNIASQNFQAERGRQQEAAMSAPGFEAAELESLVQGLQAQALPRMIEQQGIDTGLEEFRRSIGDLLQILSLGGSLGTPQTQVLPGSQGSAGFLSQAGGGLASGLGMAGANQLAPMLFGSSDRRLKSDIEKLGQYRGLGIYRYRLRNEAFKRIGVMADEVLQVKPEAVAVMPDGYLAVDYARVF